MVYKVSKDGGYTWSYEKIMGNKSTSHDYSKALNKGDVSLDSKPMMEIQYAWLFQAAVLLMRLLRLLQEWLGL